MDLVSQPAGLVDVSVCNFIIRLLITIRLCFFSHLQSTSFFLGAEELVLIHSPSSWSFVGFNDSRCSCSSCRTVNMGLFSKLNLLNSNYCIEMIELTLLNLNY